MLSKGENLVGIPTRSIITRDMKRFIMGNYRVSVSQVNVGDIEAYQEILDQVKEELNALCRDNNLDLSVLMLTSLVMGGTELIVAGEEKWLAQAAFNLEKGRDNIFVKGMFSRKKQVVPRLMEMAYS